MNKIQSIRGMSDLLPADSALWQKVETTIIDVLSSYGYQEIRFPIVEKTELFKRSIGDVTDIVEKEMYTFEDRNGDSLSLRPEGTAGCVRACIEAGLLDQTRKLWYRGPMFRHERPQKGRLRQFHQFGVEVFGLAGPDVDAEMIQMTAKLWKALGVDQSVVLELNSLGTTESRLAHRKALVAYFESHLDRLDEESQRRLKTNPLRILDTKNPELQALAEGAPQLINYLDQESKIHFEELCRLLDGMGITYRCNPRLVRGLDYYSRTVFEWVTTELGAQGTVCGGGRYDALVEQLGGKPVSALGFGLGLERLILLVQTVNPDLASVQPEVDLYVVVAAEVDSAIALQWAEALRESLPNRIISTNLGGGSFKNQFKRADRSGAEYALVLGQDEVLQDKATLKSLRTEGPQELLSITEIIERLR